MPSSERRRVGGPRRGLVLPELLRQADALAVLLVEGLDGQYLHVVVDAESRQQLVTHSAGTVLYLGASQPQALHLQLVARQVIAQGQPFLLPLLRVVDERLRQGDVLVEDALLVLQLVQLEVEAREHHPDALRVLGRRSLRHLPGYAAHADAAPDGSARIDGQAGRQGKVAAVVRDVYAKAAGQVAVRDASAAYVGEGNRSVHVGQALSLGGCNAGLRLRDGRLKTLDGGVVLVGGAEQLLQRHRQPPILGCKPPCAAPESQKHGYREQGFLAQHNDVL